MSRTVTFGEILLRLSAEGHGRFMQTPRMRAVFGGAEANVAIALARWGADAICVSALPESHPIADAAIDQLRGHGVDVSRVLRRPGRLGLYFLETGADVRPSRILYDRLDTAFSRIAPGEIDWADIFAGAARLHVTGITPAVSATAAETTREAIAAARAAGLAVSLDLNYRESLWNWGAAAADVLGELVSGADLLVANASHLVHALGIDGSSSSTEPESIQRLTSSTLKRYPSLGRVAITVRETKTGVFRWCAHLADKHAFRSSRVYEIRQIVDRIGAGDAFSAGLLYGLDTLSSDEEALGFAAAAGCLKHSVPGDVLLAGVGEVAALAGGADGAGRVER